MKKNISSLLVYIFLLAPMSIFANQILQHQEAQNIDEQLYCSLVYVNKNARESIVALTALLPEHSWSAVCKNVCLDIQENATVMPYNDVVCTIKECLEACTLLPSDKLAVIQTELQTYKKTLDTGKAHISSWRNDAEVNEMITRNFDGSREILQLYTRNLTVDGTETVNGLLTVNGIIALNGRLILNGVDINTIIANAAAAAAAAGGGSGGSSGIQTINGNTGSVTGTTVTLTSNGASGAGASITFSGSGTTMSFNTTDSNNNTFLGQGSGNTSNFNIENTGFGAFTLPLLNGGIYNTACGAFALNNIGNASGNTAVGREALAPLTGGNFNAALGYQAGVSYNNFESNNISINSPGVIGEDNTLRIGAATGNLNQQLNRAFIAGIFGVTTDVNDAIPVLIDSSGQLGTVSSSKRFKENIVPMPTSFSENVLDLSPTLFNYTQDDTKTQTWGLIAEEVQQIFPELVISDKEGLPFTVKYHELPVLLLNELKKLKNENVEMKTLFSHELASLKKELALLKQ